MSGNPGRWITLRNVWDVSTMMNRGNTAGNRKAKAGFRRPSRMLRRSSSHTSPQNFRSPPPPEASWGKGSTRPSGLASIAPGARSVRSLMVSISGLLSRAQAGPEPPDRGYPDGAVRSRGDVHPLAGQAHEHVLERRLRHRELFEPNVLVSQPHQEVGQPAAVAGALPPGPRAAHRHRGSVGGTTKATLRPRVRKPAGHGGPPDAGRA